MLRQILKGNELADLEQALCKINTYLAAEILPEAKGLAIFVRDNFGAFLLPMQFAVPVPNWIAVYPTPNIYHLVELKDTYHRYVVLLATAEHARILDVNLGAATVQAWTDRPELQGLVGEGWSRSHYQVHRANRGDRFLEEKLAVLERLMRAGGHAHLILAGDPEITAAVRRALPKDLARASTSAPAQPRNDFRAVDSAQDGPIPVADSRLASLPKTLLPVLFLGGSLGG